MYIREATETDLPAILALAETKRAEYAMYSPVFWRVAEGAVEEQRQFFINQRLHNEQSINLVAEDAGVIQGFVMALIHTAPPVYAPGGPICTLDDFTVASPELWPTVGLALLQVATEQVQARGVVLIITVCGHLDEPKRAMLQMQGATIASEWYVKPTNS